MTYLYDFISIVQFGIPAPAHSDSWGSPHSDSERSANLLVLISCVYTIHIRNCTKFYLTLRSFGIVSNMAVGVRKSISSGLKCDYIRIMAMADISGGYPKSRF